MQRRPSYIKDPIISLNFLESVDCGLVYLWRRREIKPAPDYPLLH